MPLQSDYTSSDLTHLGSTSDDAIVHNISSRWKQKLPYTRINASTLVAVNPFEVLPILNDAHAEQYADWCYRDAGETVQEPPSTDLLQRDTQPHRSKNGDKHSQHSSVHGSHHIAPHPYELAGRVYFHLRRTGQDQTIVMRQEYDK
jgi:chitin synthase